MLKEKLTSIEWRTEAFPRFVLLGSIFSIIIFWNMIDKSRAAEVETPPRQNPFATVEISAKAALVWDMNSQRIIYGKNENLPLPLASLTKVMTAVTAETIANDMDTVAIKRDDLSPEGDTGLKVGSKWNTQKLVDYFLVTSSNDGAKALAGAAAAWRLDPENANSNENDNRFVDKMNSIAKEVGLSGATFFNEHGLDIDGERSGAYGSASDMAKLFEYVLYHYPHMLEATRYPVIAVSDLDNEIYSASNTNIIIDQVPSPIASKTGYTDLAGGNLVTVFDAGMGEPIIVVVLGSSQDGRFDDMLELIKATQAYINN